MSNIDTHKSTICLNMIVKNEAHIIKRCLESVKPYIDTWVISDTGSTDGTQDLIREIMKDIPGELIEREWVNFGHNRDEVLQHAKGKADYILIIDADEWIECEEEFNFTKLTADSYYIIKSQPAQTYWVRNVIKNDMGWKWKGVLHEYLECDKANSYDDLNGVVIEARQEGARAHDPETYRKDAALLTKALIDEPDNTRYQFYLAQSWRDAGDYELAIVHYNRRIDMGGWQEEVFFSKYQIACALVSMGKDWSECMAAFLKAWEHTPERAEPLYKIGIHYMEERNWPLAWLFLNQAAKLKKPEHLLLFIQEPVYDYMALFDAAVAAGNMGYEDKMDKLHQELLNRKNLPNQIIKTAKKNYEHFKGLKEGTESVAA